MTSTRQNIVTGLSFVAFWAALMGLSSVHVAVAALTGWFWGVIGILAATQAYFLLSMVLWHRRWRGPRVRDIFWAVFPGLFAGATFLYGRWAVQHRESSPSSLALLLLIGTLIAFRYFRVLGWPWLAWLLRLRTRPVLTWSDDATGEA